jgi:hypothetical protein
MKSLSHLIWALGPLLLVSGSAPRSTHSSSAPETSPDVLSADLEAHVRFLASDELRGRMTGSPESVRAAHYLSAALERAGLEPAGDDGTFLQAVPFQRERFLALPELKLVGSDGERSARYGADFVVRQGAPGKKARVLLIRSEEDLPAEASAELALCFPEARRSRARIWLEKAGHPLGAGFALVMTPARRDGEATTEVPAPGRLHLAEDNPGGAVAWIEFGSELAGELAGGEVRSVEFDFHYELEAVPSYNVIARLRPREGQESDALASQSLVISAHYDHIGTRTPRAGEAEGEDLIFNGADDDASGVACVLEVAEAMAHGPAPAREVLFLLATAEEMGIVGTSYYLDHPSTPLEQTICNLNFEMVGRPDAKVGGSGKLWFSGGERTNLLAAFRSAGIDIEQDPYPEQRFFERSDNIVFVRRGIVGQTFSTYDLHEDYHQVSDEAETLDYTHMEGCARAGLAAVRLVASGEVTPEWLPGGQPKQRR